MTSESTRLAALCLVVSLLAACGGGGGANGESDSDAAPPANSAPSISGTPVLQVTRGQAYEFIPSAADPDGDLLTFSIENRPSWATFDTATGTLAGTPAEADIGTTADVTISVSDGALSASLEPFDLEVLQVALGSATVSWDSPTTNADASPLRDLAGFRVHYGTESGTYTNVVELAGPAINSVLLDDLEPATYFFAVTAIDSAGNESAFSEEVSKVVQP